LVKIKSANKKPLFQLLNLI